LIEEEYMAKHYISLIELQGCKVAGLHSAVSRPSRIIKNTTRGSYVNLIIIIIIAPLGIVSEDELGDIECL